MAENILERLEKQLDLLIAACEKLQHENDALKARETNWLQERARLIEKNELAKTRVESMIHRLKSLEAES